MSFKRLETDDFVVSSDSITSTLWSTGVQTLTTFFTSSVQKAGSSGDFYLSVYEADALLNTQFDIAYANSTATDQEIIEACKNSASDEFIQKLPNKYNTMIGENGVRLSGGQKQRISIARAILKKSPIILLDEATSSLDADSEQVVQNAISSLVKNKTTLVIAHRLSTIHSADQIFVLKDGSIVDSGNHDSLMKSSNEYKSLYEKQLK